MGRVGSGTIYASLQEAGYKAAHCHYLNKPSSAMSKEARNIVTKYKRDVYVISPVRRPVFRNLSAYCMNNWRTRKLNMRDFLQCYSHDVPLMWFDREFRSYWGVDVYEKPFDLERGWQIYDGFVLVIRCQDIDREWANAFRALTGLDAPPLVYLNVQKSAAYEELLSAKIPQKYLHLMRDSKYYHYFYGEWHD